MTEEQRPDRIKLADFAKVLRGMETPEMKTEWGIKIAAEIDTLLSVVCEFIESATE